VDKQISAGRQSGSLTDAFQEPSPQGLRTSKTVGHVLGQVVGFCTISGGGEYSGMEQAGQKFLSE
jgi:hypothetical protein